MEDDISPGTAGLPKNYSLGQIRETKWTKEKVSIVMRNATEKTQNSDNGYVSKTELCTERKLIESEGTDR